MDSRVRTVVKEQPVRGGYDRDDYVTERLWTRAADGVKVPISVVFRRNKSEERGPVLLYGYGAYEHSNDPMFDPARLSLLDRGFVFAIAHVRGGARWGGSGTRRDGCCANATPSRTSSRAPRSSSRMLCGP